MLKNRILSLDHLHIKTLSSHATCFIISHRSCVQFTSLSVYFPLCRDIFGLVNSHVPAFKLRISLPGSLLATFHQKKSIHYTRSLSTGAMRGNPSLRLLVIAIFIDTNLLKQFWKRRGHCLLQNGTRSDIDSHNGRKERHHI